MGSSGIRYVAIRVRKRIGRAPPIARYANGALKRSLRQSKHNTQSISQQTALEAASKANSDTVKDNNLDDEERIFFRF